VHLALFLVEMKVKVGDVPFPTTCTLQYGKGLEVLCAQPRVVSMDTL